MPHGPQAEMHSGKADVLRAFKLLRLPLTLRFSCGLPHTFLIKILIENYKHYHLIQFHSPPAANLLRPPGLSVIHVGQRLGTNSPQSVVILTACL